MEDIELNLKSKSNLSSCPFTSYGYHMFMEYQPQSQNDIQSVVHVEHELIKYPQYQILFPTRLSGVYTSLNTQLKLFRHYRLTSSIIATWIQTPILTLYLWFSHFPSFSTIHFSFQFFAIFFGQHFVKLLHF